MNKVKIIIIVNNLNSGGAEKQLVNLINNIDNSQFDIDVLLYACQNEPFYSINNLHVNIIKSKINYNFFLFKIIIAIYSIYKQLKLNKYDIILSSLFHNNLFVRIASPRRYRNKIITSIRTSFNHHNILHLLVEKYFIKHSFIIFNSKKALLEFRRIFASHYHSKLCLIYNGFEIPQINYNTSWITDNKIYKFGSLGRLSVEKNMIQPLRVFSNSELSKYEFILQGGAGNQSKDIDQYKIFENIKIFDKNSNIELFFNSIDILIIPSKFEGCPNVLFEGLLRNKLCIISIGANSDSFIVNGINGLVYDGTDAGLLKTITNLLNMNRDNLTTIVNNGYKYAYENFTIKALVTNYEKLFRTIYDKNN